MLQKLPKSLQGEIYQFLNRNELARMEAVSRKVSLGARQDYIWRYLSENTLEIATSKWQGESWKGYYLRSSMASEHLTRERFNYVMCPIRHFKEIVTMVESYNNFVFAADTKGRVGLFLIHERDLENEQEGMQVENLEFPEGVEYLKHYVRDGSSQLVIVTSSAAVHTFTIEQTGPGAFNHAHLGTVQLPMLQPQNLYVCPLNEAGTLLYISNYPLDGNDFMADQTVTIYNAALGQITFSQVLTLVQDSSSHNLSQTLLSMGQFQGFFNNHPWGGIRPQILRPQYQAVPMAQYKSERHKQRLAVFDGSRLVISLFTNQLVIVETQMSAVERFLKKTNIFFYQTEDQEGKPLAVDLRLHKGTMIAFHLHYVKTFDFLNMQLTGGHDLGAGSCPNSLMTLNPATDELKLIRKVNEKLEVITMKLADKKIQAPISRLESDEKHQLNDIDATRHILASATSEGGVKFRRFAAFDQAYFINAGSRTVKTQMAHPYKQGVTLIKISVNKVVVVLSNVIRVYSFDFVQK